MIGSFIQLVFAYNPSPPPSLPPFKVSPNPRKLSQRHRYKSRSLARSSLPFFSVPSPILPLLISATRIIYSRNLWCSFSHPVPFVIELGKVLEIVGGWRLECCRISTIRVGDYRRSVLLQRSYVRGSLFRGVVWSGSEVLRWCWHGPPNR